MRLRPTPIVTRAPRPGPACVPGGVSCRGSRLARLLWLLIAGFLALTPPLAAADAPPALPRDITALRDLLGVPARPEAVQEALHRLHPEDGPGAERLATALGRAGGHAALAPLSRLLGDSRGEVRLAALRAAARVRLRSPDVVRRVCDIIDRRVGEERHLAILLLGRLGDGRHVERLILCAAAEDEKAAHAALTSLAMLTGTAIPPVRARWQYWWRNAQRRLARELRAELADLERHAAAPAAEDACRSIARLGWVDLPTLEQALGRWLRQKEPSLRLCAVSLVAALRLGAFADELHRLDLSVRRDTRLSAALAQAMAALGLRSEAAGK